MNAYDRCLVMEEFVAEIDARLSSWPRMSKSGMRVAVVGSGPLGLSCSRFLAQCGHEVVVYESQQKPGGIMRSSALVDGVSEDALDRSLNALLAESGIQLVCGHEIDSVELAAIAVWYDVVYIATGTSLGRFGLTAQRQRSVTDALVHSGDYPNVIVNGSRVDNPSDIRTSVEAGEAVAFEIETLSNKVW